jgi:hypothetical protein
MNNNNEMMIKEIHCIPIKLPAVIEMQLKNNRLLREAINNYRRHKRDTTLSKNTKISSVKTNNEAEDILIIEAEPLCPTESNSSQNSTILSNPKANLTKLMKQIHDQCKNTTNKVCVSSYNKFTPSSFSIEKEYINC